MSDTEALLAPALPVQPEELSNSDRVTDRYNILVLSSAFFILFTAYNSLQNYVTSLLPGNLGNVSLATLYTSVCVFVFIAPPLLKRLGDKLTLVFGAVTYVLYMVSLIKVRLDCSSEHDPTNTSQD